MSGPPTSAAVRGAGWVEAAVLAAAARGDSDGAIAVRRDGLDDHGRRAVSRSRSPAASRSTRWCVRSYCVGAAAMAIGWVTSEGLAVDE